jgi:hypothetical protein
MSEEAAARLKAWLDSIEHPQLPLFKQELYSARWINESQIRFVKFNGYFDILSIHVSTNEDKRIWKCECAGFVRNSTCRHQQLRRLFVEHQKLNTGWFYNWTTDKWELPLNSPVRNLRRTS